MAYRMDEYATIGTVHKQNGLRKKERKRETERQTDRDRQTERDDS